MSARVRRHCTLFLGDLFGQVDNCRVGSGFLDRLNTLLRVGLLLICLAGGNDLAVGRLEVPPELAGLVLADFEYGACSTSTPPTPSCACRWRFAAWSVGKKAGHRLRRTSTSCSMSGRIAKRQVNARGVTFPLFDKTSRENFCGRQAQRNPVGQEPNWGQTTVRIAARRLAEGSGKEAFTEPVERFRRATRLVHLV
jgi:hypothetical protein